MVAAILYAVVAAGSAIAAPVLLLPADPWFEAGRAVRAEARAGDLVLLFPAARLDRLRAFDGVWAVAADATAVDLLDAFQRIFWVGETNARPPAGFGRRWTRRFGNVDVSLLEKGLAGERPQSDDTQARP